jgi:hypothetical protein
MTITRRAATAAEDSEPEASTPLIPAKRQASSSKASAAKPKCAKSTFLFIQHSKP